MSRPGLDGIAVIGLAGRFPGASRIEDYWRNLTEGRESIRRFSDEELAAAGVDPDLRSAPGYVPARGVLDDIEEVDAPFFGLSPREAEIMDPQHRLFLECAWEALERAGYDPQGCKGLVGVYAGANLSSYLLNNLLPNRELMRSVSTLQAQIGNDKDYLATRVSYKLRLKGPSLTVQTACSSSLVAVHLASQSLFQEECDMALAGGVSILLPQKSGYPFQEEGIVSPDGHCRAFDAAAAGTVFSNGAGVVVLKRLEDAMSDGDLVSAVILGSAVNNDGGFKVGFTAPGVEGQAEVILEALTNAGIDAGTVSYVEAHGTGTALGDPIEVAALTRAFRQATDRRGFCALGSVKTNIGHLSMASGVAGLIKVVLMLRHRLLPPSLHFREPNPRIDFGASPFYVNAALAEWKSDGPRRAGVSSFGFGGTNAHVVLQEVSKPLPGGDAAPVQLLVLSARTPTALDAAASALARRLAAGEDLVLADVAYTLQVGRTAFSHRRTLICRDLDEARRLLQAPDPERVATAHQERRDRPVAFLFPGQGAQHPRMGADLYREEPLFRREIDRCAALLRPILGRDLRTVLFAETGEEAELLDETAWAQPALLAVEYALAQWWMSLGVSPAVMIGHSLGEYVAACLAGVFGLEDALGVVAERGRLMQSLPPGAMLAVPLPEVEIEPWLRDGLCLAAVNGPERCVVSGPVPAVEELERALGRDLPVRRLRTSRAFHSGMTEPVLEDFAAVLRKVELRPPGIPFLSCLTGEPITPAQARDPEYWVGQARHTVRFGPGIEYLEREPGRILLEVGPGRGLTGLAGLQVSRRGESLAIPSLPRAGGLGVTEAVSQLWLAGATLDWHGLHRRGRRRRVELPTYPFERRRYWIDPPGARVGGAAATALSPEAEHDAVSPAVAPRPSDRYARPVLATPYLQPRSDLERRLCEICQEFLGVDRVGVHDGFFELGGDSLLATQVITRVREEFGQELPLRDLLERPTVSKWAAAIGERRAGRAGDRAVEELLAEVKRLSREEVLALLGGDPPARKEGSDE